MERLNKNILETLEDAKVDVPLSKGFCVEVVQIENRVNNLSPNSIMGSIA